jgi:ribokinase
VTLPAFQIVVVGSLNADLVVALDRFPAPGETVRGTGFAVFPGGKGGNQACAAAKVGGHVAMVGQVGADDHGTRLVSSLADAGVVTRFVDTNATAPTGVAIITRDRTGENEIVIVAGANGTLMPSDLAHASDAIRQATVLMLQLEVPLETVIHGASTARNGGALVLLDPAPARDVPDELLQLASIVTPNETELAALTGGAFDPGDAGAVDARCRRLLDRGAAAVIAKLGVHGARLVTGDGSHAQPPFDVACVDSTAAGDAFNGALAVSLAEGRRLRDALPFAAAAAALSVTRQGAQPSMPTRAEVDALLRSAPS